MQAIIAPSLLAADFGRLADECRRMEDAGADWLHLDVMDGHFVPNLSIGPAIVSALRPPCKLVFDCHLMVSDPHKWIEPFAKAGVDRITFHLEASEDALSICHDIRKRDLKVGVALKPKSPIDGLFPLIDANLVDMVLIMTVEPGFGGQAFMPECMPKVEELRRRYPDLFIQVDGGLNAETTLVAAKAGANVIVAGTSLFRSKQPQQLIHEMRQSVNAYCIKTNI